METSLFYNLKKRAAQVSWPLLVFLLLVLNVKLVIKVIAILLVCIYNRKEFSVKGFFRQRYLWFYFGMIGIGFINGLLQYRSLNISYGVTAAIGLSFWAMCALISYQLFIIVQKEDAAKVHHAICFFFILHFAVIGLDFLSIVFETGSINPYTYKGLNQKYYISTGDSITGITLDAPVTTAFICAFGLLYFLYRKQFFLSLISMAALLIMASNFANLVLTGVFLFAFVFYSNRLQKSFILVSLVMLVLFMVKISPQNNEHVGRIFYQIIDKPYDLPPEKIIPLSQLKKEPDSVLSFEERRKKYAQNYIDSMNAVRLGADFTEPESILEKKISLDTGTSANNTVFYQFKESEVTEKKITQYSAFMDEMYPPAKEDSLKQRYNWKNPGKFIAAKQLYDHFTTHPGQAITGTGIGNFSSRLAFKATLLNIAGRYPAKWKYVNNDFLYNHLFLYLYFHSQDQSKHEASNTPDSVYSQVLGEYGIAGILLLLILYFGFFIRRVSKNDYGLPLLLLLAGAFFAEYWFEQFSIVVLFELLFFVHIKDRRREEQAV